MGQFNWECCALFVILTIFSTTESYKDNDVKGHHWYIGKKPGTWLESERNKRNILYEERNPLIEQEQLDTIMETLQEHPWSVVAVNEGKRHTNNFTPRLGRESEEENEQTNWVANSDTNREMFRARSPPFAPRLGRRMNTYYFDPRLGKRTQNKV